MPAYYFAMEGYHAGDKPDPATDTVISIQYQKIDLTTGEPLEKLTILKAWEDSEKSIVTRFYNQFLKAGIPVTQFIPVGMNLDYAFELILAKCRQYHLPALTSRELYYQRPRFDLAPVIVLLNDGRFKGAGLDTFSAKKSDAGRINTWYERKEFRPIEHTLQDEAETFLKLLQYLSKYKTRLGVTRKGAPVRHRPAEPSPARTENAHPSRNDPPALSSVTAEKPAAKKTPALHKSSARIAKAQPPRKSHAGSRPASPHASKPLTPLRKHTPTDKSAGKK